MNKYSPSHWAFAPCLILLCCYIAAPGHARERHEHSKPHQKTDFGDFRVNRWHPSALEAHIDPCTVIWTLVHRNRDILDMDNCDCPHVTVEKPVEGVPRKGCRMLRIRCHTGGSQCCSRQLFLTSCGGRDGVTIIYVDRGNPNFPMKDVDSNGTVELILEDRDVLSNTLCGQARDYIPSQFSCGMTRLGVYDEPRNGWRVDSPGEFPAFYSNLLGEKKTIAAKNSAKWKKKLPEKELKEGDEEYQLIINEMPPLLEAVYYALMAGLSDVEARNLLDPVEPYLGEMGANEQFKLLVKCMAEFSTLRTLPAQSLRASKARIVDTTRSNTARHGAPKPARLAR